MANTVQTLNTVNTILELVNGLLPNLISFGHEIIGDLRSKGSNVQGFTEEEARFRAAIDSAMNANTDWYAQHGLTPPGQPTPTPAPAPAPAQPPTPVDPNAPPAPSAQPSSAPVAAPAQPVRSDQDTGQQQPNQQPQSSAPPQNNSQS